MDKIYRILKNIQDNIPQALVRINDGEAGIINDVNYTAARGQQKGSESLREELIKCLQHNQENYWIGTPCTTCATKWYNMVEGYVNKNYKYLTSAVVTTNRNWKLFSSQLPRLLDSKVVYWIGGEDQRTDKLPFKVNLSLQVPISNSWNEWETLKNNFEIFKTGSIILLSCGPLSRPLTRHYFENRPDCTFLDIGSVFDPWTRNVRLNCHNGTVAPCKECN